MGFCEFLAGLKMMEDSVTERERVKKDTEQIKQKALDMLMSGSSADECKQYVLDATLRLYGTIDIENNPLTKCFLVDLAEELSRLSGQKISFF